MVTTPLGAPEKRLQPMYRHFPQPSPSMSPQGSHSVSSHIQVAVAMSPAPPPRPRSASLSDIKVLSSSGRVKAEARPGPEQAVATRSRSSSGGTRRRISIMLRSSRVPSLRRRSRGAAQPQPCPPASVFVRRGGYDLPQCSSVVVACAFRFEVSEEGQPE